MIYIHSKYGNLHKNRIFYVLICINTHVNSCINFMLSGMHMHMRARERQEKRSMRGGARGEKKKERGSEMMMSYDGMGEEE